MNDAYAAGLFDGEGCVVIANNMDSYSLRCQISICNEEVTQLFQDSFGGGQRADKRKAPSIPSYSWSVCGKESELFLRRVLDYLVVKREVAILGLEFLEHKKRYPLRGLDPVAREEIQKVHAAYKRDLSFLNKTT